MSISDIAVIRFVATFDTGKPIDKESFTKLILKAAEDRSRKQIASGRDVTIDGDTAIVVGDDQLNGTDGREGIRVADGLYRDVCPPIGAVDGTRIAYRGREAR